jgi:hypothetical protein
MSAGLLLEPWVPVAEGGRQVVVEDVRTDLEEEMGERSEFMGAPRSKRTPLRARGEGSLVLIQVVAGATI